MRHVFNDGGKSTWHLKPVMKEVLFLRQVWRFMLPDVGMPCIPVFEDNEGAVQLASNPITNCNLKHIDVRRRFLRKLQVVGRKAKPAIHVGSIFQHADFFTKTKGWGRFRIPLQLCDGFVQIYVVIFGFRVTALL